MVNVIASEDPVDFIGAERLSSNTIGLKFSRAMKDASDCPVNAFSLNITNGENMIPVVDKYSISKYGCQYCKTCIRY